MAVPQPPHDNSTDYKWPPQPPDITFTDMLEACERVPFCVSIHAQLYRFKDKRLVFKAHGSERELEMMRLAKDCAVTVRCRVFMNRPGWGGVTMEGIVMDQETPLDCKAIKQNTSPKDLAKIMRQMIFCVETLHSQHRIIHGDIKPENMLLCHDGKVRLCDFAEARPITEEPSEWEGDVTVNYISPDRTRNGYPYNGIIPPSIDDLYALGLSIWELHTGQMPFEDTYCDDIVEDLRNGGTVDVYRVLQEDVRDIILAYLRLGGARV